MDFTQLLFGHLFGDYVFQNKWMAVNKSASSFKSLVHCIVYTACICLFTQNFSILWALIVMLSHFPIDRFSIADAWLKLINGRSLSSFLENGDRDIPEQVNWRNYHSLRGGFTSIVYTVTDNTMHLALMYFGYLLLNKYF